MIVILGGNGYVGRAFQRELQRRNVEFESWSRAQVDYSQALVLDSTLRDRRPDFVINCAGYTGKPNVDACELHRTECLQGNAVLPGIIDNVCGQLGVPWGHVSSGCIYSGKRVDGGGFRETDPPNFSFRQNNCSFYSGCKALGEEVLKPGGHRYVWRLRIPFDEFDSSRNYLSKLQSYDRLLDVENSLSHLGEFVSACVDCFERAVVYGSYNLTNPGSVTTREVVDVIEAIRPTGKQYEFFEDEAEFMNLAAKAPRSNCVLDSSKAIDAGLKLSPIREALEMAMRGWQMSHGVAY